jgi:hypothetical protein
MSDCHNLFQTYHEKILIDTDKKNKINTSKASLRARIRKWFKENQPEYTPKFYIQGSMKMKSAIKTKDDICDLDDGVYFFREPDVKATTLQGWVWDAVNGYTSTTPEHRKKCIRTIFSGDYEIDHPVYYKVDGKEYQLAIKNEGWRDDDPKAMVDWFVNKKDKGGRLLRIVKYLKAWCDNKRNNMPSGLAMTILSSNTLDKIVLNARDDISLRDVLSEIKKILDTKFECLVPVTPKDNLFSDYNQVRKDNFLSALNSFLDDANKAIREDNQLKSSKLWQKHLGSRFPDGKDESDNSKSKSSIAAGAASSNPWVNG